MSVLQKYPESIKYFSESAATAADIQEFYLPSYTTDNADLKTKEEAIIYNFGKFLKKAERMYSKLAVMLDIMVLQYICLDQSVVLAVSVLIYCIPDNPW